MSTYTLSPTAHIDTVTVSLGVRGSNGGPLDNPALVHFFSNSLGFNTTSYTQESSSVTFRNVPPGDYEVEVKCPGYRPITERVVILGIGNAQSVYVYVAPESEASATPSGGGPPRMTPKLQSEIDKGVELMGKHKAEDAQKHFSKAVQLAPGNPDVLYLLAASELSLNQKDQATANLQKALSLYPTHEKSLLALANLQLENSDTASAIKTLEKAYAANGASWRTHLLLATAYQQTGRLSEAEPHAFRAAQLAGPKAAPAMLFLGEIQFSEGKYGDARKTWEQLVAEFPKDPASADAKRKLAIPVPEYASAKVVTSSVITLPPPQPPSLELSPVAERAWAPPDVDSTEYSIAAGADCQTQDVLDRAVHRMQAQLENFEKFIATEHIEHQEVDRFGIAGPSKTRDFSYIVFVHPFHGDSIYLEEERDGGAGASSFPTSLATTGLNSLGVSVLQPAYRDSFLYSCEGLTNVRGQAAWQIHFLQKRGSVAAVRTWRRNGTIYDIPLKGRVWISSASYDLLRIETDLREPYELLQLTRDHLLVDYGPVSFQGGSQHLWLPWSAEMYLELHNRRYHHKHFLSDYMLFSVDSSNKINKPKDQPKEEPDESPNNPK